MTTVDMDIHSLHCGPNHFVGTNTPGDMPDYLFEMLLRIQRFLSSSEVDTRQNHVGFATHPTTASSSHSNSAAKSNIQILGTLPFLCHVCRNLTPYYSTRASSGSKDYIHHII
ncbi:hypothetical protein VNO77_33419 [Canavalia gladiata]|uniref:Uncharacterized protein n=1 Tax=Canavalia gladiata TaxID=3824 RepID=A0AAN9KBR9_CANGL